MEEARTAGSLGSMISGAGRGIHLACGATDLRMSIDGLCAVTSGVLGLEPQDGSIFVFCNRGRNRLKMLEWGRDGFWLHSKRLEAGRYDWPAGEGLSMEMSAEELRQLLDNPSLLIKFRRVSLG
jgi:transposase